MSEHASSNKRQRTDSDATGPEKDVNGPNVIKRDDEFWFEDGNIVLIARDIEFRVYKGILAKHSSVFQDMFSLPPPVAPEPSQDMAPPADACPVVHLSDSPEDLRHVLRACMSDTNLSSGSFSTGGPPFHMVSAVIRIGHKYQMEKVVARAVMFLKQRAPMRFWEQESAPPPRFYGPQGVMNPIGLVNLARLVEERSLLPMALLTCSMLDATTLLRGYKHEDGTVETLTQADLVRCLDAREQLAEKCLVLVTRIFAPSESDECRNPTMCRKKLWDMLAGVERRVDFFVRPDVTSSRLGPYEHTVMLECCANCQEMLRTRDKRERRMMWNELPEIMGVHVERWGEL